MFSIITVNKNNCTGLKKTLDSVFSQGYKNYESVVVDAKSTDGSIVYLKSVQNKISKLIIEDDLNAYDGMNKGILRSTNDYLIFLNSGDYFIDSTILEKLYSFIHDNKHSDIFFGGIQFETATGIKSILYTKHLSLEDWRSWTINHNACVIKKKLFQEIGLYDIKINLAADYFWFLKALINSKTFINVDFVIINYDIEGMSSKLYKSYVTQMKKAWSDVIPIEVDKLLNDFIELKILHSFKIVKFAIEVNSLYQNLKIRIKHFFNGN